MTATDASLYFARRAPRYRLALSRCPTARVLDFIPYIAIFLHSGISNSDVKRVCDAFGGTGFIGSGLEASKLRFVVCDCCDAMLQGASNSPNTEAVHVTDDDFDSVLRMYGQESFDVVLSHGGFHHVVESADGKRDERRSRERQSQLAQRLSNLLRPGGVLVITDIPDNPPTELLSPILEIPIDRANLRGFLGEPAVRAIEYFLSINLTDRWSLEAIRSRIQERLVTNVPFPVPRYFFDNFIATDSPLGHVAVYPDFDGLHSALTTSGLAPLGRINYCAPWLFYSEPQAGWFFREKFAFFSSAQLGADAATEQEMASRLKDFLGMRIEPGRVAVNWGVTYAAYTRSA